MRALGVVVLVSLVLVGCGSQGQDLPGGDSGKDTLASHHWLDGKDGVRFGEAESQLRLALDVVRGPAFAEVPDHRFAWLPVTGVEDIALAVGLTAVTLAGLAADRGDSDAAVAAVERGLELLPANEDLWCSRLLLARRFGSRTDVEDVAARMYDALDGHGSPIGATARTDSLVADLLPGWSRQVA